MNIRLERGDPRIVDLPKVATDAIYAGDIVWWASGSSAVRPASAATGADHDARANVVGTNFVGVAMATREAGDTGLVPVATAGDFVFPFAGAAPVTLGPVRVADNSGAPHNQTLEVAATPAHMVGRAITTSGSNVRLRILSRLDEVTA